MGAPIVDIESNVRVAKRKPKAEIKAPPAPLTGDELIDRARATREEFEKRRAAIAQLQVEQRGLEDRAKQLEGEIATTHDAASVAGLAEQLDAAKKRLAVVEPSKAAAERFAGEALKVWQAAEDRLSARGLEQKNLLTVAAYDVAAQEYEACLSRASALALELARLENELQGEMQSAIEVRKRTPCNLKFAHALVPLLAHPDSMVSWRPPGAVRQEIAQILGKSLVFFSA
ncbi:MAG: hypothetical protein ABSF61_06555 [Anaerolineales bacterium]|jgi:hypothetical protein